MKECVTEWIMFLEAPWEDCEQGQEPEQRMWMLTQVQAIQPVGGKVSIRTLRS